MHTHSTLTTQRAVPRSRLLGSTLLATACAGLLVWSTTAAYAGSINGLTMNGLYPNGLASNGVSQNGVYANGLTMNGLYPNGLTSNWVTINGLPQDRCVLGASKLDTELLPLDQVQHLHWHRLSHQGLGAPQP